MAFSREAGDAPVGRVERQIPYVDVPQFSRLMSGVRGIISSKLHLGIFGMACGGVFFSYGGREKTHAQLRELGLQSQILLTADLPAWLLRLRKGVPDEREAAAARLPALRARARGHVTDLLAFLRAETGGALMPGGSLSV